jgi:hypothetical protein
MLNYKQSNFIECYIKHNGNISTTCKDLNITRQTAYIYLKNKDIKDEIEKKQQEIMQETLIKMQNNLTKATDELMKIIECKNTNDNVKINAINSLFNNWNKVFNDREIMQKIKDLEDKIINTTKDSPQDTIENIINNSNE